MGFEDEWIGEAKDNPTTKARSSTSSYEPPGHGLATPLYRIITLTAWILPLPKICVVLIVLTPDEVGLTVLINFHSGLVESLA